MEATFLGLRMVQKAYQGEASAAEGEVNDGMEAWVCMTGAVAVAYSELA